MTQRLLDEKWRAFREILVQAEVSVPMRRVMRRAFYAGASAFNELLTTNLDQGGEPTQADLATLGGILAELSDFEREILEGRA